MTRLVILATVVVVLALGMAAPAGAAVVTASNSTPYYLALGDSLSQGVQPNAAGMSVETNQGYANDLWSQLRGATPRLKLEKLGCPGETTSTMIDGGICSYSLGSQLAQATDFLTTHRVTLVTIDIGANDIDSCVSATGIDQSCLMAGFAAAQANMPTILAALRQAAPSVRMVAMNYYDPFVVAALKGGADVALAQQSVQLGTTFNQLLTAAYLGYGIPVADVEHAFAPLDLPGLAGLNLAVSAVLTCVYSWMCAPAPVGPNIHATPLGYRVIASVFAQKIS